MADLIYYLICGVLAISLMLGIAMMGCVATAVKGNLFSALAVAGAIILTLFRNGLLGEYGLWICIVACVFAGLYAARKIKMIEMPQAVALLNGFTGGASALIGVVTLLNKTETDLFSVYTAGIAIALGMIVFAGSVVAVAKLHKLMTQRPVRVKGYKIINVAALLIMFAAILFIPVANGALPLLIIICAVFSGLYGVVFSLRVGGADMPITIALLNSLSGVAEGIAGMAVGDPLLVSVGGVIGSAGLILTQIMCRAMNRSLASVLFGANESAAKISKTNAEANSSGEPAVESESEVPEDEIENGEEQAISTVEASAKILSEAGSVIIVPGYGMALAQAQEFVKELADRLEARGASVKYAIHPVAGRMPGHMNVLLAEVDVPYDQLFEMDEINREFAECGAALVIGANDVINPAANIAEGTPIYGMPILNVENARRVIICNYDGKPGYAGVDNPLYRGGKAALLFGDAKETLRALIDNI